MRKWLLLTLAVMFLAACSGGQGGPSGPTYQVSYVADDAVSGAPPVDEDDYEKGDEVTVLGNSKNLAKSGFNFAGWNTKSDRTGTSYASKATFKMGSEDITLYPVWVPENFKFTSSGTDISINGYVVEPTGELTIPAAGVTSVSGGFGSCEGLTSVIISEGITSISSAFEFCDNLASVSLPSTLKVVGDNAFYYCGGLSDITIPSSVTEIGDQAFDHCVKLTRVVVPNGVVAIRSRAFASCTGLISITIPSSVTVIEMGAFTTCTKLSTIILPSSISVISQGMFSVCGLTSITLPESITSIEERAFNMCD